MDNFKILTDEEFAALSNAERRKYLKAKKEYENQKLVEDTLTKDDSSEISYNAIESKKQDNVSTTEIHVQKHCPDDAQGLDRNTPKKTLIPKEKKKIQVSITCTPAQRDRFKEAARKDHRNFPQFVCLAVEEYMENHNL